MRPLNSKGQAMAESLLTLPLLILAFAAILLLSYRGLIFYSVDTQLHEALICLDDDTVSTCKGHLHKSIRRLIVFNMPFSVELRRAGSQASGEVRIDFRNLMKHNSVMIIRKQMSFPLKVTAK